MFSFIYKIKKPFALFTDGASGFFRERRTLSVKSNRSCQSERWYRQNNHNSHFGIVHAAQV